MTSDIQKTFDFIIELEKLKSVLRKTKPLGCERYENSAEHSWQVCMLAVLLAKRSPKPIDIVRVVEMLLVHDIPEIDVGDQIVYQGKDASAIQTERRAAERIFGLLPESHRSWCFVRWAEYEARQSDEAIFAYAVDRLMPVLQNLNNSGQSWIENRVPLEKILSVNAAIGDAMPSVWEYVQSLIEKFNDSKLFQQEIVNLQLDAKAGVASSAPCFKLGIEKPDVRIPTEISNCFLRPWLAGDKSALQEHANNRKVWRNMTESFPHPYTEVDANIWLGIASTPGTSIHFAIEFDGKAIGGVGVIAGEGISRHTGQFGYWLAEPHWGKGIATAAARAMAAHAMASGHFTRLEAPVFSWNLASMRVLEKVGFVREGILRRSVFKDGQFTDSVMYAQVRNDELPEPLLPTLNTHRLILRPYTLADAPDSQRLAGNKLIAATTTTIPHPYPDGAAEAWIATHAQLIAEKRAMPFAVTLKENGELIGNASLIDISLQHKRAELGYWIGVDYWSQGYCTEAAQALMNYAHDVLGITRIVARCHAKNVASARVMEKCGLVHEGTLPLHMEKWGVFEDTRLYGMVYAERGEKKDQTDILAND